jgi:hypothetical protein
MKRSAATTVLLLSFLAVRLNADIFHKFEIWGKLDNDTQKILFYTGWVDGFFHSRPVATALMSCVDGISVEQGVALIDRRYKDHPEVWSMAMSIQILESLAGTSGPCSGKNPFETKTASGR